MKRLCIMLGASGNLGTPLATQIRNHFEFIPLNSRDGHQILEDGKGVDSLERRLREFGRLRSPEVILINAQSPLYKSLIPLEIETLIKVNVELPLILADYAHIHGSKVVYTSSGSVYLPSSNPLTESSRRFSNSMDPYIQSKLTMEDKLQNLMQEKLIIIRPFYIFGPFQREHSLFHRLIMRIVAGENIELSGGVGMHFNPIFALDAANLIFRIIQVNDQGIFNIAGMEPTNLKHVIELLGKALKKRPRIIENASSASYAIADSSKAWQILNGTKGTPLEQALRRTILS